MKKDIDYIKEYKEENALDYAISIIKGYEYDINNSKNYDWVGVDLVEKGFCQGTIFKNALKRIEELGGNGSK